MQDTNKVLGLAAFLALSSVPDPGVPRDWTLTGEKRGRKADPHKKAKRKQAKSARKRNRR